MPRNSESDKYGDAYAAVKLIYDRSPGQSWRRLNGALQGVLSDSITAMLSFKEDDFQAIYEHFKGHFWMGDGAGSHFGEGFYSHAVEIGHTPACISFEKWVGRPAVLWPERTKTPERLRVGSRFTWDGLRVTVTSLKEDRLIACTYKDGALSNFSELKEGGLVYAGRARYRRIDEVRQLGNGDTLLRVGKEVEETGRVDRRFRISYEELTLKRKEYDTRRKAVVKAINDAETPEALTTVIESFRSPDESAKGIQKLYRHFDIEQIQAAIEAKRKSFKDAAMKAAQALAEGDRLQKWLAGEDVGSHFSQTMLRIRGTYVEVTNGQRASVESVRRALPIVLKRRKKLGPIEGVDVDFHEVRRLTEKVCR